MRILVVDDETFALEETKGVVAQIKPEAEVIGVNNYVQALQTVEKQTIDLAVLDIELPGINGLELAKPLKEKKPDINIIFATGYTEYALSAYSVYLVQEQKNQLQIQCFGKFEVFYKGNAVKFEREQSKEILAYLIDLKGASTNTSEICMALWEEDRDEKKRHYFRNLISYLKKALQECHGDVLAINSYHGEYMKQYSWAEFTLGHLEKLNNKFLD